ncbi:class I SAM-dependent methyltransferase [Stenotrophomonas sp. MMGLT7]|uniref:class I SAM-dependent methyltransferase n=1 Tax=Stenotrophomonas sp. MMGLT7 TaxID=2901227 RepID=UPI001E5EB140|nr:class I SAM-dependent methyltransferase [Stenotrophomonas sp. MMGLT7]MCD7097711.1 class I SAM-dependent methyltransferase [Stenotrophomonas sp. MMGLT7]
MNAAEAQAIARAFLPAHPLGNRYDYYYTRTKLRTDPLYPGVLAALRGTAAPLLDLGCGLGLLAHALRADGQALDYHGVDIDAAKIRRAVAIAQRSQLHGTRFDVVDLGQSWPEHRGSVAILDVLQYLQADVQAGLIRKAAGMLAPGAKLVIRSGLGDDSRRGRTSRVSDFLAHFSGWMQELPKSFPTRDSLQRQLDDAGLQATFSPLYGNTPFNNWLVVAGR